VSLSFRFADPDEIPDVARLVSHSFPGPGRTHEWWVEYLRTPPFGGGPETLWVGEQDGRIVAACQLHPLRQWVAGVSLPLMGLGTVAISPVHRKRRLAAQLVASGLRVARERGDLASALYPFRISFYHKLGYGLAGEALQYRIPPDVLPDSPERLRVELVGSEAGRAEVRALYAAWARRQTGQLERTDGMWARLLAEMDRALVAYRDVNGALQGYALVRYRADLPPQERFLEVEECAWLTPAARRGLYGWLGSMGDQWREIVYRALPEQGFANWIREPRLPMASAPSWGLWFPSASLLSGPMFRTLDLAACWERRSVAPDASLAVAVEVEDGQVEENGGRWVLRLEGGTAGVERDGVAADATVRLDVSTLSRLYVGALAPSAAAEAGLLSVDRPALLPALDHALRLPSPWTWDRF